VKYPLLTDFLICCTTRMGLWTASCMCYARWQCSHTTAWHTISLVVQWPLGRETIFNRWPSHVFVNEQAISYR